jgi:chromosome segregation ATPase
MNQQETMWKATDRNTHATSGQPPTIDSQEATHPAGIDHQKQAERFLAAQAEQIRQHVKAELRELDARLHEKAALLQCVASRVTDLQLQLAEKQLILDARNTEVNDLKTLVSKLSQQLAQLQRVESQSPRPVTDTSFNEKQWTFQEQATGENRNGDYSLGEPILTEAQNFRLSRYEEWSRPVDAETKNNLGTPSRRWHSHRARKRRWKIWSGTSS